MRKLDLAVDYIDKTKDESCSVKRENGRYNVKRIDVTVIKKECEIKAGRYITLRNLSDLSNDEKIKYYTFAVAKGVRDILEEIVPKKNAKILVVGLGNRRIVADSLGSLVAGKIIVTRHNHKEYMQTINKDIKCVSCLSPSVSGVTGITSFEAIYGNIAAIKPNAVIIIDSLMADGVEDISSSVQITDSGITPGSAVGETTGRVNKETLNIPVISIGAPFVSSMEKYDSVLPNEFCITKRAIDIDVIKMADVIANGVNMALYEFLSYEEIAQLTK